MNINPFNRKDDTFRYFVDGDGKWVQEADDTGKLLILPDYLQLAIKYLIEVAEFAHVEALEAAFTGLVRGFVGGYNELANVLMKIPVSVCRDGDYYMIDPGFERHIWKQYDQATVIRNLEADPDIITYDCGLIVFRCD